MRGQLKLPAVLSIVVMTSGGVAAVVGGCGDGSPDPDARLADAPRVDARLPDATVCVNYCFPDGTGTGDECPFPTCATGVSFDECPDHCDVGI